MQSICPSPGQDIVSAAKGRKPVKRQLSAEATAALFGVPEGSSSTSESQTSPLASTRQRHGTVLPTPGLLANNSSDSKHSEAPPERAHPPCGVFRPFGVTLFGSSQGGPTPRCPTLPQAPTLAAPDESGPVIQALGVPGVGKCPAAGSSMNGGAPPQGLLRSPRCICFVTAQRGSRPPRGVTLEDFSSQPQCGTSRSLGLCGPLGASNIRFLSHVR